MQVLEYDLCPVFICETVKDYADLCEEMGSIDISGLGRFLAWSREQCLIIINAWALEDDVQFWTVLCHEFGHYLGVMFFDDVSEEFADDVAFDMLEEMGVSTREIVKRAL